jgi:hypothetical protein
VLVVDDGGGGDGGGGGGVGLFWWLGGVLNFRLHCRADTKRLKKKKKGQKMYNGENINVNHLQNNLYIFTDIS